MATSVGDIKLQILADTTSLGESLKTGLQMISLFSANAANLIKLKPALSTAEFSASMDKLIADGKKFESAVKGTAEAEKKLSEETKNATKSVIDEVRSMNEGSGSVQRFARTLSNIGFAVEGLRAVSSTFKSLKTEFVDAGLSLEVLRGSFNGTQQDLEFFRTATANTVTDASLIKLSNQAFDLGVSLRDQAILFAMAEDAGDKYGEGVEQGFQRVIFATEGSDKALKSLGIQKAEYRKTVEELTAAFIAENNLIDENNEKRKLTINDLPVEEQKRIRLDAIIKSSGLTYNDVSNKVMDNKDKMESLTVAIQNQREEIGAFIGRGLIRLIDTLGSVGLASKETAGFFVSLGKATADILPIIAQLKIAFPGLASTITAHFGKGGPVYLAILGTLLLLNGILDRMDEINAEKTRIRNMQAPPPEPYQTKITIKDGKKVSETQELKPGFTPPAPIDATAFMKQQADDMKKFQEERNKREEDFTEELQKQSRSKGGSSNTNETVEETDAVRDLIDTWEKQINIYYTADALKSKFSETGMSLVDVLSAVNASLSDNTEKTDEQIRKLIEYRDEILDLINEASGGFDAGFRIGNEDPIEMAKRYTQERMKWYDQYGSKDKRFKPLDEIKEFIDAIKLIKELKGEQVSLNDLQNFSNSLKEKAEKIDDTTLEKAKQKNNLLKEAKIYEDEIQKIKKKALDAESDLLKIKIGNITNEFQRKEQEIINDFLDRSAKINAQIKTSQSPQETLALEKTLAALQKKRDTDLAENKRNRVRAIQDEVFSSFESAISTAVKIYSIFGDASDGIVRGFQKALEIVNTIKAVMDTVSIIKSVLSLLSAPLTGGASLAFASGGFVPGSGDSDTVPAWLTPGEFVIRKSRTQALQSTFGSDFLSWLNGGSLFSSSNRYASGGMVSALQSQPLIVREVPYITSTNINGSDIKLVLKRVDKLDNLLKL